MTTYYNEIDPFAAQWLRNLIDAGHIAPGVVDERDIRDVRPDELAGFHQCHFFAGIGVWSHALRAAGWHDDRPVWTGSCPCQPFSAAGRGAGFADERHLWPHFHHLISQRRPPVVFGEQVASKDGLAWLDLVQADLEGAGHAFGAVDLCAAGVGSPNIRQRLYWVADASGERRDWGEGSARPTGRDRAQDGGAIGRMADTDGRECDRLPGGQGRECDGQATGRQQGDGEPQCRGEAGGVANAKGDGWREERPNAGWGFAGDRAEGRAAGSMSSGADGRPSPANGFWRDADWLFCRDGKWRPVESGTFPLVDGAAGRVGRLRAYGNAINAEVAQAFIEAYCDAWGIGGRPELISRAILAAEGRAG